MVYMTAGDRDEARSIGRALVESGLAACANILDRMTSIYAWEGTIQEDSEVVVIAKTTAERFPELKARVEAMHSYDCPCILAVDVMQGHGPFLDWIRDSVGGDMRC